MVAFTPTDITLLIGATSTALASVFLVIQRSRCTTVKCCGVHCERNVDDLEAQPEQLDAITQTDIESRLSSTLSNARATRSSSPVRPSVAHLVGNLERRA
jgi:hypothetical protein